MSNCKFYSFPQYNDFVPLSDLVELELGLGSGGLPFFGSIPKLKVPNFEKLKVYVLDMDFITTSLKFLEFREHHSFCVSTLLLLNLGLEELKCFNSQFRNANANPRSKKSTLERLKDWNPFILHASTTS